jgi:hypothetical protein
MREKEREKERGREGEREGERKSERKIERGRESMVPKIIPFKGVWFQTGSHENYGGESWNHIFITPGSRHVLWCVPEMIKRWS